MACVAVEVNAGESIRVALRSQRAENLSKKIVGDVEGTEDKKKSDKEAKKVRCLLSLLFSLPLLAASARCLCSLPLLAASSR